MNLPSVNNGKGSPPLARERLQICLYNMRNIRITPAGAGKTIYREGGIWLCGDHPRWRGKDSYIIYNIWFTEGSPPLARERLFLSPTSTAACGITPAGAGKTSKFYKILSSRWDHPRWRGKDSKRSLYSSHYCRL